MKHALLHACLGAATLSASALAAHASAQPSDPRDQSDKGPRRPPQEAFDACSGHAEGDSCEVTFHDETHAGTCIAHRDKELFCMPNDMPPPPAGGRPPPRSSAGE